MLSHSNDPFERFHLTIVTCYCPILEPTFAQFLGRLLMLPWDLGESHQQTLPEGGFEFTLPNGASDSAQAVPRDSRSGPDNQI